MLLPRLFLLSFLVSLSVQAGPVRTADHVLPQVGQRGTEAVVAIRGHYLETAEEILFYQAGIRRTAIKPLGEWQDRRDGKMQPLTAPVGALECTFQIDPEARVGEYFFRVRTRKKLSELLSFWVTPFPIVHEQHIYTDTEEAGNDTPARAEPVPLNCTVLGYQPTGAVNDFDLYKVRLQAGQRCTAQMLSARLGTYHDGGLTDMALEVHAPSGARIGRCDDSSLLAQDPLVTFVAGEAGDYVITVRQQMDYETQARHYALHIGDFPRPTVTYPLGGPAGTKLNLTTWFEGGDQTSLSATLPDTVGLFEQALVPLTDLVEFTAPIPTPNLLKIAEFPNVLEAHRHHTPDQAQSVDQALPFALNGIIINEGERDWFRFRAKKGERYRVRAYAQTLGSRLDPFIWIRPAPGNPSTREYECDDSLWDGHDWEGHHYRHQVKDRLDPVFMFEPDEDGEYLLGVTDTRREAGPDYVYRIEFQPHRDAIFTYMPPYPSQSEIVRDNISIHRGTTYTRPLAIQNGFGSRFDGPMTFEAVGLPDSVQFHCPTFTKDDPTIMVAFEVGSEAPLTARTFELVPRPVDASVQLDGGLAQTSASTDRRGGFAMVFNKTRKMSLAVLDAAPFDVRLEEPKIGLAKNAELELVAHITRKGDFKDAVYLEVEWLPLGITRQPPLIIPAGKTTGTYAISATKNAAAGRYKLSIMAREYEGGSPNTGVGYHYVASPLVEVEVTDPYLSVELQRGAIEQGTTGKLRGVLTHFRPFPGLATARLLRLPNGVELIQQPTIKPGQKDLVFPLRVSADALTGQYKQISCDIIITEVGQKIHQQSGDGVLRIDQARK